MTLELTSEEVSALKEALTQCCLIEKIRLGRIINILKNELDYN